MTNQPLLDFILTEVKQGATKDSIAKELLGAGWEAVDIEEGFKAAGINDTTPITTPVVNISQPTFTGPNPTTNSNVSAPVSNPVSTNTQTFSTLDSYANPNPGNNSYNSSPVYSGQVVSTEQSTKTSGGKKVLLFVIVLLIVIAGGVVYAIKTNKINLSFIKNLASNKTTAVEKTSTTKVTPVTTVPENQAPVNSNLSTTTATTTTTVAPLAPVLPTTSLLPSNSTTKPATVPTTPVSVVTSMPDLKPLCKDIPCKTYFGVWLKEQMYQINIAKSYLNAHIVPQSMKIASWVDGKSFEITYDFVMDWAKVRVLDSFMVKTVPDDAQYPSLKLRKGIYFSEAEVRTVVTNGAYNSQFLWFTPATSLMFATKQDAINAIKKIDTTKKFEISTNAEFLPVGQKPNIKKEL